jgi:hypothetical protein
MTQDAPAGHPDGPKTTINVDAESFVEVIAGQVATLHGLSLSLESSMSQSMCTCEPLGQAQIQMLQRVDFLRQSLRDIDAILNFIGPRLAWGGHEAPKAEDLIEAVDMRESLTGLVSTPATSPPPQPSDAGVPDLWD